MCETGANGNEERQQNECRTSASWETPSWIKNENPSEDKIIWGLPIEAAATAKNLI